MMPDILNLKALSVTTWWEAGLEQESQQDYMSNLREFLKRREEAGAIIYPPAKDTFNAFNTQFNEVKVVILGQDPYHGPNQAHGLCFSVLRGVTPPPSLQNIFRELESDLGIRRAEHGNLGRWAMQGVFLLNSVLTVEKDKPGSHQGKGWERFTDKAIELLSGERDNIVFMLWGSYAQKKGAIVDRSRHLVLEAPHPSPLSAHRGFLGCRHFSRANAYLEQHGKTPIDWEL